MNTLLVRPTTDGYAVPPPDMPTGLLYLAPVLKKAGHDVTVRDLEFEELGNLSEFNVCGISIMSKCRRNAFDLIRQIKKQYPEMKIIAGGAHVSALPELVLENEPVDAVVVGEGEQAVLEAMDGGGIFSAPLIEDLDSIPFPDYDQVDFSRYYMQQQKFHPDWVVNGVKFGDAQYACIITSRGCYGRCSFCLAWKHWGLKLRYRSAQNIADELELLNKKYNVSMIAMNDNIFGGNKKIVLELCEEIQKRGLKIAWKADTRADVIDKELATAMRESGCFMIAMGLESASPVILNNIHKSYNLDKVRESILAIKEAGIIAYTLLMVGNEGETSETIKETVGFLNEVKPHYTSWVTGVMVCPGTLYDKLNKTREEFWASGKDLPYFLKEHTYEELGKYALMLGEIEKDSLPEFS